MAEKTRNVVYIEATWGEVVHEAQIVYPSSEYRSRTDFALAGAVAGVYRFLSDQTKQIRTSQPSTDIFAETSTWPDDYDIENPDHINPETPESDQWLTLWDEDKKTLEWKYTLRGDMAGSDFQAGGTYNGKTFESCARTYKLEKQKLAEISV